MPRNDGHKFLEDRLRGLEAYIVKNGYRGYDPFDALMSPLFSLPVLKSSKIIRLGFQQVMKRLPLNIRPLLGIRKGYNPVTLGLAIQAYSYLANIFPEQEDLYRDRVGSLIAELERLVSKGYHGACWGYDFDWQAKYATVPAYMPTIVATGIITNALFSAYSLLNMKRAFELCESATRFLLRDLNMTKTSEEAFCWSYSPNDTQMVLNASMKGARLCAQVGGVTGDANLLQYAADAVRFVASQQRENGAFIYAVNDARSWVDHFHTGYVLDCFDEYERSTGDRSFTTVKIKGWEYYRSNFFLENGTPKYYDTRVWPVDATSCGQALLTLCRFGDLEFAERVAKFCCMNMQTERGYCYYRRYALYTNRISYMRWSNAWIFAGLTFFFFSGNDRKN
jgi:hypothetical protein